MPYNWTSELWRILASLALAVFFGWIFDQILPALLLAVSFWFAIYFLRLKKLDHWLRFDRKQEPPLSNGLWGEVFTAIYRLQQRARKRNKRLVKAINRFRETTAALPDGVVVLRREGEIEWWNAEAGRLLQLKYPQDVGLRLANLLRDPSVVDFWSGEDQAESVIINSPYHESIRISLRRVDYGNKQTLVIVRDVTMVEQVQQMRRDFVANISHELRTPLTVMSGFIEAMTDEQDLDEKTLQRSLLLMKQQSKRMHRLVEDLMLLSRLENEQGRIRREVVAVPQMLTSLWEEARIISGERHHQISMELDDKLYLYGDSKQLDSAFSNLVINAINYTQAGGAINIRWYEDADGAHMSVSDTGIGIPSHHIPRITERFYRVDVARSRETGGSGLGLAIVKHALNLHHATLSIDSEVGRGSTFICHFPHDVVVHRGESAVVNQQKADPARQ